MGKTLKELNVKPGDVVSFGMGDITITSIDPHYDGVRMLDNVKLKRLGNATPWYIVSRAAPEIDLTAITTPLGLLDDAARDALKAHGGPYEEYCVEGWLDTGPVKYWANADVIRVKPSPKVETVDLYGSEELHWIFSGSTVDCDTHKLTLTIQDGEIIGVTAEKLE